MDAWRSRLLLCAVGVSLFLSACGGSGAANSTTYWRANFQGGTSLYMSFARSGEAVSGWAKYGDGTFQHYIGTANSDGTFNAGVYGGSTIKVDGGKMTVTNSEQSNEWASISKSDYTTAGGPS
jgi:hypothetical protein